MSGEAPEQKGTPKYTFSDLETKLTQKRWSLDNGLLICQSAT